MRFVTTAVKDVLTVELEGQADSRGYFGRLFCQQQMVGAGVDMRVVQVNISRNARRLTLRGMHYQAEPDGEPKIVLCIRGRIFDVALDLRPDSPTYRRWASVELATDLNRALYIPRGCAHGFLTLEDDSDILYLMGSRFVPHAARGVRWNDPVFGIEWPAQPLELSPRDAQYSDFAPS